MDSNNNSSNDPVPGWNAHRRPQDPLRPPKYLMKDVPKCAKDLKGSVLQEIRDRDHFKEAMAEMVQLCTEAMRRTSANRCSSKPLSLEYIADRLDVDDPSFGYLVRSPEGMLQGFITLTTFTNWQRTFRWDSLHELAFYYDDSDSEEDDEENDNNSSRNNNNNNGKKKGKKGRRGSQRPKRQRRVDRDGSLARELEQTVRFGDPYNEGIVWPRIAEVSLLGALGCGRKLVELAIEQLEFQKASGSANYDYVALQATDNSIPFYESLGFVRVGAVTVQPPKESSSGGDDDNDNDNDDDSDAERQRSSSPVSTTSTEESAALAEPLPPSSPEKPEVLALPLDIVSSPLTTYEVKRKGETPTHIAKVNEINVWDIIFLNKEIYKEIAPSSRLMKGTILHIPCNRKSLQDEASQNTAPAKWFVAKENDTPRKIAKMFSLPCKKLVDANRNRLPELQPTSRLKAGTRIKVSNLDQHDDVCDPYCHWSFPDDSLVEGGEPSYMMVYKLERKTVRCPRDVRNSLAVPITKDYSPPQLLLPAPEPIKTVILHPDAPKPPPEPPQAKDIFKNHLRGLYPDEFQARTEASEKELEQRWKNLAATKQERYQMVAQETRRHYERDYAQYQLEYQVWESECETRQPTIVVEKEASLFNKVVKLRDDAPEGQEYSYWFVLTYIPDLKWCHLAPMVQDGVFGPERKRSNGRPRWRLVDEKFGKELDTSSMYCIPVRSKTIKKTADADKEEWDILDGGGGNGPISGMGDISLSLSSSSAQAPLETQGPRRIIRKQPLRARTAIKPMGGMLTVVKPSSTGTSTTSARMDSLHHSPSTPTRHPHRFSPTQRNRGYTSPPPPPPRFSPRLKMTTTTTTTITKTTSPSKRHSTNQENEDMAPPRKARRINNAGARRCALQL